LFIQPQLVVHSAASSSSLRRARSGLDATPREALVAAARFSLFDAEHRVTIRRGDDATRPISAGWRLLADNNRDIGRGARVFSSTEQCLAAIRHLKDNLDLAQSSVARSHDRQWFWIVRIDGIESAVSSRTYQRRIQADTALAVFLSLVRRADVVGDSHDALEHV